MGFALQPILRTCYKLKLRKNKLTNHDFTRFIYVVNDSNRDLGHGEITQISETIIKDKLKAFSVPFTDGYTCFHVKDCSLCSHQNKKPASLNTPDIFINKKTGFFLCDQCKVTGNWFTFNGLLNKSKDEKSTREVDTFKDGCVKYDKQFVNWDVIVEQTSPLHKLDNSSYSNVLKSFNLTVCSKDHVEKLQVRINKEKNILYFPLFCSGSNVVGYKTLDQDGKTSTLPRIDCPGFLLLPNENKSVVLVGEVADFFALMSQNLPFQILCLPYGITNLPQNLLPFLETYDKIILWLGGVRALDATGNFAKKLNYRRCYVVRPTENQTSAVTALSKKENLGKILANAKPTWHQFVTTFNSLREEVLAELQNKEQVVGVTWTRFSGLNKILKGHRRGELTVLTGPTGSGKTTFMSEYSLDLAMQGVNTLWGSFEIKNSRLARTMLQQFAGIPLAENLDRFDSWADKFEQLPIFFMTFHGQQPLSVVMDAVEHCSYTYDIAHVIIDNVQFMIEVSPDAFQIDRFWKQDYLIQSFRSFASKNNCHVTLVMHPKKGMDGVDLSVNSIFGGAKAAQEADNVFIIQNKRLNPLIGKKFLQISKNRFSGELGAIPLEFDKSTLSFSRKSEDSDHVVATTETNNDRKNQWEGGSEKPNKYKK